MRRTRGCLGNTPTFLAVCKKCSRRFLCTGDAGHGPPGSTHSYPDWAAFPAAFFIAYGRPNHERSSPPLLTVLLLLTGEHLEEVGGVKNERDGTSEAWALQGSFFVVPGSPARVLWEMLWEMLSCVRSLSHAFPGGLSLTYMNSHPLRFC